MDIISHYVVILAWTMLVAALITCCAIGIPHWQLRGAVRIKRHIAELRKLLHEIENDIDQAHRGLKRVHLRKLEEEHASLVYCLVLLERRYTRYMNNAIRRLKLYEGLAYSMNKPFLQPVSSFFSGLSQSMGSRIRIVTQAA